MPSLSAMTAEVKRLPKNAAPKKTSKSVATKILAKSTEYLNQSDMESETESEEESESEEEPVQSTKPVVIIPKSNGIKAKAASPSSSSGSEEDSDDDSSEEESSEEESGNEGEETIIPEKTPSVIPESSKGPAVPAISSIKFSPPTGFEPLFTKPDGRTAASSIFNSSYLAGKEVWYITAPASIPISKIKKVSMRDVQAGKPAITLDGQEYGFVQEKSEEMPRTRVILPDDAGGHYRLGKSTINQTLHLQHIVKLPNEGPQESGSQVTSKATIPTQKPVRQQPVGLRMRFLPIGFGNGEAGNLGSSDEDEDMDDAPVFRAPSGLNQTKSKKKPSKQAFTAAAASSSSEEEPTSSDEEMEDALPVRAKKVLPITPKSMKRKQTS